MADAKILGRRGILASAKQTRTLYSSESSRSEEDTDISMKSDGPCGLSGSSSSKDDESDSAQIAPSELQHKSNVEIHRCTHCSHVCEHFTNGSIDSTTNTNSSSSDNSTGNSATNNNNVTTTTSDLSSEHHHHNDKKAIKTARKSDWVKLNIGGTVFQTTRTTLCTDRGSFLYRLCQDDDFIQSEKDENGAYLIDRDPAYFAPILNYLRHGKVIINKDINEDGVLEEAEFYGITGMIKVLKQRFSDKLSSTDNPDNSVYRLLHCSETELPLVISTLSDGWKFQQLIPNLPNWSNDFLMVVSRDYPNK